MILSVSLATLFGIIFVTLCIMVKQQRPGLLIGLAFGLMLAATAVGHVLVRAIEQGARNFL